MRSDSRLAISLSVWQSVADLRHFVHKTVHGAFLRRRAEWFAPWDDPNYVIWPVPVGSTITLADGIGRLDQLARQGASPAAYAFSWQEQASKD